MGQLKMKFVVFYVTETLKLFKRIGDKWFLKTFLANISVISEARLRRIAVEALYTLSLQDSDF